ncbi:MGMT family protein [Patescibacteria group bacterium]|nr:MGMT family protein [Patescibacteria group bacterium]
MRFEKKVFKVVKKIPKGKVMTYAEVAKTAGSPRAWRAVGNILNKNKNLKIPCHRVIKSNGKVGGYNLGKRKKIILLKREGIKIKKGKILPL